MALTNALLKSFGLEQDQRDAIMTAHQETLESIKAERDKLQDTAAQVPSLEKQIEELKAASEGENDWKAKYDEAAVVRDKLQDDYNKLNGEFESYRQQVATDRADAEKLSLYKSLLREIGLDDTRVEKVAKLKDLSELTVEDGKLAGYDELKASESSEWAPFIPHDNGVKPANVATPPKVAPTDEGADPDIKAMLEQRHTDRYGTKE